MLLPLFINIAQYNTYYIFDRFKLCVRKIFVFHLVMVFYYLISVILLFLNYDAQIYIIPILHIVIFATYILHFVTKPEYTADVTNPT